MLNFVLDLRYLSCALSAAQHGSFRRAAATLGLPQSTVSRRIKLLEHALGFPLFVRDGRGARLTVAGADFLNGAVEGARHLEHAAHLAFDLHRRDRSELRIGIVASLAEGFLHDLVRRFRDIHCDVRVIYREGTPDETLRAVIMGQLDISFVLGEPQIPGHESRVLWSESIYAVLPKSHTLAQRASITWDDLRDEVFIVTRAGRGAEIKEILAIRLASAGIDPRVEVHDVSRGSLLALVEMERGITIAIASTAAEDTVGLAFRLLAGERDALPSSALWQSGNANPALRRIVEMAEEIAKDQLVKSTKSYDGPGSIG